MAFTPEVVFVGLAVMAIVGIATWLIGRRNPTYAAIFLALVIAFMMWLNTI